MDGDREDIKGYGVEVFVYVIPVFHGFIFPYIFSIIQSVTGFLFYNSSISK